MTLTGHADTVGSQDLNVALAQRRADAVRNALVREGVPAAAITTGAQGEASLPVQTADNVDERLNRSVDISVVSQMARTGMTDAEYCAALSASFRTFAPHRLTRRPRPQWRSARRATRRPAFPCSRERLR